MREVELKSVVDDVLACRAHVEAAGGVLDYEGSLVDMRYGDPGGALALQDHVLRLRIYRTDSGEKGYLDWKGRTQYENGYKLREEVSSSVGAPSALAQILENLGYVVIREIERAIAQYSFDGATIRFEEYPRMDALVEVEGPPEAIERAIAATGLPRDGFTAERLPDFLSRFEARTGERAAVSARELRGEYRYRTEDA